MSAGWCDDCGCRTQGGYCVNCDEEVFIAEQYYELDMPLPDEDTQFMKNYRKSVNEKEWKSL